MIEMLLALQVLASAAPPQTANQNGSPAVAYSAAIQTQYAAHSRPSAQRPEEAQRAYDAYLNSIGQKAKTTSTDSSTASNTDIQPH